MVYHHITMTNDDKFKAIVERLNAQDWCNTPLYISIMVIISYLVDLKERGLIDCEYEITELGKKITSVCEEFEWKPSDEHIKQFVNDTIDDSEKLAFECMICKYRDNKEELIKEINSIMNIEDGGDVSLSD